MKNAHKTLTVRLRWMLRRMKRYLDRTPQARTRRRRLFLRLCRLATRLMKLLLLLLQTLSLLRELIRVLSRSWQGSDRS